MACIWSRDVNKAEFQPNLLLARTPEEPIESHGDDGGVRIALDSNSDRWQINISYDSDQAEASCDLLAVLVWVKRWRPELLGASHGLSHQMDQTCRTIAHRN